MPRGIMAVNLPNTLKNPHEYSKNYWNLTLAPQNPKDFLKKSPYKTIVNIQCIGFRRIFYWQKINKINQMNKI